MDHSDEKPPSAKLAKNTVLDPKRAPRNSWLHKMRAQLSQEMTRETTPNRNASRKRPKPSMPPTPWDNSKD